MNARWWLRFGINPEPRHDLDYWFLTPDDHVLARKAFFAWFRGRLVDDTLRAWLVASGATRATDAASEPPATSPRPEPSPSPDGPDTPRH